MGAPSTREALRENFGRVHVLLAEALRCLDDAQFASVRRKVAYADVLVCELEALAASDVSAEPPSQERIIDQDGSFGCADYTYHERTQRVHVYHNGLKVCACGERRLSDASAEQVTDAD
jgi:hypothetical protein